MSTRPVPANILALDLQVCFAVYSTALAFSKAYQPLLKELELTYSQYLVMLVLWEDDGKSVSEIGKILFLDSGTLTPMLKRIEALGLITRERSMTDERQVLVRLTEKGRKLKKKAEVIPAEMLCKVDCTPGELKAIVGGLQTLRSKLNETNLDQKSNINPNHKTKSKRKK